MTLTQDTRPIALFTPLGADVLLLARMFGRESLSQTYEYELEAYSADSQLDPRQIVGRNVSWRIDHTAQRVRWFNGYVSQFRNRGRNDRFSVYEVVVVPWLWFLSQSTDSRIFQHVSTPEIVERVFRDLGFSDFTWKLSGSYAPRDYCVQYRETDLNFVSRLLEEEGIYYYFRHENGAHQLILADSPTGWYDLADGQVQYSTQGHEVGIIDQIKDWRRTVSFRPGAVTLNDYNFRTPRTRLHVAETTVKQLGGNDRYELYEYPARYSHTETGRNFARVRMEEQESQHDLVTGTSTYRSFSPGGSFQVLNHRMRSELGKSYAITSVTTQASVRENYATGTGNGSAGVEFRNEFTGIPAGSAYRPPRTARKAIVKGPQTAVVVGPAGEEIYTDEFGRVKVQFHWDREASYNENSSCWLRVSQSHAGQRFGSIDIPRIGEEVVVNFLEGDPDQPIIKGRVYNAAKMPPFPLPGAMTRSGGKSNTHKGSGYNEMSMDDTAGKEQIRINAQYNMDTTVGNDQTLAVGVDRTESIGNNDTTKVGVDATSTVGNNQATTVGTNMNVDVANNLVITAGTSITLKTGASKIHMNQAGVITISSTVVTSAAAVTNTVIAPMTQVVGSCVLNELGMINLKVGGVTKVAAKTGASVGGATVSTRGNEVVVKGLPIMLGEVGAPLAQLPAAPNVPGADGVDSPDAPDSSSSESEGGSDLSGGEQPTPAEQAEGKPAPAGAEADGDTQEQESNDDSGKPPGVPKVVGAKPVSAEGKPPGTPQVVGAQPVAGEGKPNSDSSSDTDSKQQPVPLEDVLKQGGKKDDLPDAIQLPPEWDERSKQMVNDANALKNSDPKKQDHEYGAAIGVDDQGKLHMGETQYIGVNGVDGVKRDKIPDGTTYVGEIHVHPDPPTTFSNTDVADFGPDPDQKVNVLQTSQGTNVIVKADDTSFPASSITYTKPDGSPGIKANPEYKQQDDAVQKIDDGTPQGRDQAVQYQADTNKFGNYSGSDGVVNQVKPTDDTKQDGPSSP